MSAEQLAPCHVSTLMTCRTPVQQVVGLPGRTTDTDPEHYNKEMRCDKRET
jgi:hypothetical protein